MSDNALVPYRPLSPETLDEAVSRQFYSWEKRGRGWNLYDFAVDPEPPFRPFYLFEPPGRAPVDDGRVHSFFSQWFNGAGGNPANSASAERHALAEYEAAIADDSEPEFCDYYHEEFSELRLLLPDGMRPARGTVEQFVATLVHAVHPLSFEVVGTKDEICVQFAACPHDIQQLRQQFTGHHFEASFVETGDHLSSVWLNGLPGCRIVDFGLSEEFFVPLGAVSNLDFDPLIGVVAALSQLDDGQAGVFQVLFSKCKYDWSTEISEAVLRLEDTGFFSHIPDVKPLAKEKLRSPLYSVVMRAAARSDDDQSSMSIVRNIAAALSQVTRAGGNHLIPLTNDGYPEEYQEQALLNRQTFRSGMLLNRDELVSLVHPPAASVRSPKLARASTRTRPAPAISQGHSLLLGINEHQGQAHEVTISDDHRTRHMHVIGSSGSGKSTLLLTMIKQDMEAGHGLCVLDPHGDLIDDVIRRVPGSRIGDVILFDPSDADFPVAFNILEAKTELEKTILSSDLIATFRRMSTSWGDVMDSVLANAILALVENTRGGTLFDLKRFLVEPDFREEILKTATDQNVRYFWEHEFPLISGKPQSSILIRLDAFLRQKLVRNIVCQKDMKFNFREAMDRKKILLLKLSQGLIGEENAYLLGTLLVSKIYQVAITRQDSSTRPYFWLYIDEFHHFITPSMERVLAGTRKYNLGLILAHQEFRQMQSRSQDVASSVLSNCFTRICFRMGDADAEKFAGGFSFFDAKALLNLGVGEAIGRVERAEYDFNLRTEMLARVAQDVAKTKAESVTRSSRERFARPREEVERDLEITIVRKTIPAKSQNPARKTKEGTARKPPIPHTEQPPPTPFTETSVGDRIGMLDVSAGPRPSVGPVPNDENRQHKYLQSLVKRIGESMDYRATLEKPVPDRGGRVDVALENDHLRIACEISVTNEPAYEIKNVKKCLEAGFDRVVVISSDGRHLNKIEKLVFAEILEVEQSKIAFKQPDAFYGWLEEVTGDNVPTEKVKGFKVRMKVNSMDEAKRLSKTKAISSIVLGAIRRLREKPDKKK